MALSDDDRAPEQASGKAEHVEQTSSDSSAGSNGGGRTVPPLWLSGLFLSGLVLLYAGQRLILKWETVATFATWGGVALMLVGTAGRFSPMFRGGGGYAGVARLLDGLQLLGLLGVTLFGLSTESGAALLGLDGEGAEHLLTVLHVCWVVAIAVSITGLVFSEIALHPMRDASHLEQGRVRAAAVSGVTLALAASYGSLFVYSAAKQEAQADFSYFKTSEPGEATVKLLQRASKPVQVTAFFPKVNQVRKEVEGYLTKLAHASGNLDVRVVDRYLEPALAKELKAVSDGTVVLSLDDSTKTVRVGTKIEKARKTLMKFDGEFYEELVKLVTSRRTVYWTTGHGELNDQDRNAQDQARSAKIVEELLKRQNLRVSDLGLSQGLGKDVPDDADAVLVLGPTQPFAPEEIAALGRYADRGGKILLALDIDGIATRQAVGLGGASEPEAAAGTTNEPADKAATDDTRDGDVKAGEEAEQAAVPEEFRWLTKLASTVGATFVPAVLADPAAHVVRRNDPSDRIIMPTNRFSSHASVSTLSRNSSRAAVVVMGASYLQAKDGNKGKPTVTLRTLASAFEDKDRNFEMNSGEKRNTFSLGVALTHKPESDQASAAAEAQAIDEGAAGAPSAGEDDPAKAGPHQDKDEPAPAGEGAAEAEETKAPEEMRAFVIADADVFSDMLMERVVGNQMLLIDAVRWLVGEESLAGEIESEEDVRVEHTKQEDVVWFYSTIFGVPALVLAAGVWTSRRLRRAPAQKRSKASAASPGAEA